jgi:HEAT repeat protein
MRGKSMMQNFEEHLLGSDRVKGDDDSALNMSSALQSLRFRLGLEHTPSLGNRLESQEDALQNLYHRDWTIRVEAIRILATSGKQEFVKLLAALFQDENVAVREAVAKALGELGGEASVTPLVSCLKDEDWSVRATALQSLGQLGEFAPIESLVASLEDEDVSVRLAAVSALEKLAKRVPMKVFITVLRDKEDFVRKAATRVVKRLLEHSEHYVLENEHYPALTPALPQWSSVQRRDHPHDEISATTSGKENVHKRCGIAFQAVALGPEDLAEMLMADPKGLEAAIKEGIERFLQKRGGENVHVEVTLEPAEQKGIEYSALRVRLLQYRNELERPVPEIPGKNRDVEAIFKSEQEGDQPARIDQVQLTPALDRPVRLLEFEGACGTLG